MVVEKRYNELLGINLKKNLKIILIYFLILDELSSYSKFPGMYYTYKLEYYVLKCIAGEKFAKKVSQTLTNLDELYNL